MSLGGIELIHGNFIKHNHSRQTTIWIQMVVLEIKVYGLWFYFLVTIESLVISDHWVMSWWWTGNRPWLKLMMLMILAHSLAKVLHHIGWNSILRTDLFYGWFNSFRPSDAIWRHRSGSTLAKVMACCLTAPSHYLNQCWLIISKMQLHSSDGNFTRDTSVIND